jgi:hypothetical protein
VARDSCSCRKKNVRAPSIPEVSPRATSAPPSRRPIHRGRSTLSRRVGRWRKRARWVWRKLNAVPKALRIVVVAVTILAIFFATNLVYHVVLKPTEMFAPVSGTFNKSPIETWRQYAPLFREYSTASISPELLAALAQVEGAGNPVASTYWRWRLTWNPFAIYQPASSSAGMYQMTDAAFAEARPYCIRHHIVVEDGCSLTGLDSRVPPSRAIELAAVFLDRKVTVILARLKAPPSAQQKRELAAIIHLCGASPAKAFARRGFHPIPGECCGDQEVATYLAQINVMTREFLRIEAEK